jgi:hypothetical protein
MKGCIKTFVAAMFLFLILFVAGCGDNGDPIGGGDNNGGTGNNNNGGGGGVVFLTLA